MTKENEKNNVAASNSGHLTDKYSTCRPLAIDKSKKFLTVKEFCQEFQVTRSVVYLLITEDPTFPVVNLGFKKKFFINMEEIESWAFKRAYQVQFNNTKVPSLARFLNKTED